jgi:FSR family fosmidomycin resistance protein-like MFS transporter
MTLRGTSKSAQGLDVPADAGPAPVAATDVFAGPPAEAEAGTARRPAGSPAYNVLFAISFAHLLNDLMQSLFPALYPTLRSELGLSYAQIGLITLMWQATAAVLQPLVGYFNDLDPRPYALAISVAFVAGGVFLLSGAPSFPIVLLASAIVGIGSSVFHPESSRVARMASGGRYGLAQSLFQVGGNIGLACGPLFAAFVVVTQQRATVAWLSLLALLSGTVLWNVGRWVRRQGAATAEATRRAASHSLSRRQQGFALAILLTLIFSKYVYLASLTSYYPLYLIDRFGVSVQSSQRHLFVFLASVALGTLIGGPLGDRFGRKVMIWISIVGVFPFAFLLPYVDLLWTGIFTVLIGLILSSAFSTIVVFGQQIAPGNVGAISGLFFGFAFGMGGLGAVGLGLLADAISIVTVYHLCSFLPLLGLLTAFLPNLAQERS